MTTLRIASDLHTEFSNRMYQFEDPTDDNHNQVLILAGDITTFADFDQSVSLLNSYGAQFRSVILVPGNHEYYGCQLDVVDKISKQMNDNVHILDNDTITIGDITFIGSTLWTDINKGNPIYKFKVAQKLNDFKYIKNKNKKFTVDKFISLNSKANDYINTQLIAATGKVVVISHHAPTEESVNPRYRNCMSTFGYVNTNTYPLIVEHEPDIWIHGHTHYSFDYNSCDTKTRIICNPRGYSNMHENSNFIENLLVHI